MSECVAVCVVECVAVCVAVSEMNGNVGVTMTTMSSFTFYTNA